MPKVPKQRFVKLTVDEISIVDSPANEHEYIVVKRLQNQENGDMADANTEAMQTSNDATDTAVAKNNGENETPENVTVEVAKAQSGAVEKAMTQVVQLVETITKATHKPSETPPEPPKEVDTEKGKNPAAMYKAQLVKAGVSGDALTKAMDEFNKVFPQSFKPGASAQPPLKKGDTGAVKKNQTEDNTPQADGDETDVTKALDALVIGIQKAKAFTPTRQKELEKALEVLMSLAKELGMKEIPTGGMPATTVPGNTKFGDTGLKPIMKALEDLKTAVEEQSAQMTDVSKRVETIEKTRQPSQSVDGDGDPDQQSTKKSFWAGVL